MGLSFSGALTPTGRTTTRANKAPTWSSTGNLGQTLGNKPFTANLLGSDPEGATIKYGIYDGGVIPSGLTLSETGVLSGTPANNPGVKTFPIYITDGVDVIPQTFTLEIQNATPVWATLAGSLGTINENTAFSISLSASDENLDTLTFTKTAGTLPPGLTLASDGTLSGTTGQVNQTTVYNFTVQVNDGATGLSSRAFSITVNNNINEPPVWSTAAGSLGILNEQTDFSYNLSVTDPDVDDTITYGVSSGTLPIGLTLNTATGVISGNTGVATGNVTYDFMISAQDGHNPIIYRAFSITVLNNINEPPVWTTAAGNIGSFNQGASINFSFVATDQNGDGITYSLTSGALPTGLSLSSAGALTGSTSQTGTFNFTVTATDTNSGTTARAFSLVSQVLNDPYWNNVSLLMHLNGTGSTYIDNGSFNRTGFVTTGAITQTNTVSKFGTSSMVFSSGHLTNTACDCITGGTTPFTIEFWYKSATKPTSGNYYFLCGQAGSFPMNFWSGTNGPFYGVWVGSTGAVLWQMYGGSNNNIAISGSANICDGNWHHFAVSNSASGMRMFIDGTQDGSTYGSSIYTAAKPTSASGFYFGETSSGGQVAAGYLDELRITDGVARYTSNFTSSLPSSAFIDGPVWTTSTLPNYSTGVAYNQTVVATGSTVIYSVVSGTLPTGLSLNSSTGVISGTSSASSSATITIRATDINTSYADRTFTINVGDPSFTNVSLLLHLDNNWNDSSTRNLSISSSGATLSSTQSKFGGYSAYFAGSQTTAPKTTSATYLQFTGSTHMTWECWVYPTTTAQGAVLFFNNAGGTAQITPGIYWQNGYFYMEWWTGTGYSYAGDIQTTIPRVAASINNWHHVAGVYTQTSGNTGTAKMFINGTQSGDTVSCSPNSTQYGNSDTLWLGLYSYSGGTIIPFTGYIDEVRITKGVARYTANFTPPTTPFPNS
jgi:hypothetical protein